MNNELERILGEVADDATRRSGNLPVDELRGRGVRRRRTRQAGYSVVGVAAAFGLAFGAAQILPDDGVVGPAVTPTAPLPTADSSLPLGACGSDVSNMPVIDANMSLEMAPVALRLAMGDLPRLTMALYNYGPGDLELEAGTVAYLMIVKDGAVVGLSKPSAGEPLPVVAEGEAEAITGFGPVFQCSPGEHLASDDSALSRVHLPPGQYTTYAAFGKALTDTDPDWAFSFVGREGTLTVFEAGAGEVPDADASDEPSANPDNEKLAAVDVELPVCGEPIAGFEFPEGVHVDPEVPLEVTVGHTGIDDAGDETFYTDGYGDQLQVTLDFVNRVADWASARELDAGIVVARDGVVVAELDLPSWQDLEWTLWPLSESRSFSPTEDWVDCASGEHGQVPKGDYEILGWRTFEFTDADGASGSLTVGYEPVPFTAYDFEDPDNPGPGTD